MIIKGSQRAGAKDLAQHLMKAEDNEHIDVHELRGFVSDDLADALREAEYVAKGTKCRQFLFSVSMNPPMGESVPVEAFEQPVALDALLDAREATIQAVVANMPDDHRRFLIGFERGEPDWALLGLENVADLPAIRWRQQNLDKLTPEARGHLVDSLVRVLAQ